ncbi:AI-2E family transporter [Labedella endophytica]|uniref:AI-2E family transporter n=1 Tax=Labedella endophytica TaxID=1523160 RepID=A0A3S0Y2B5_9MICO|nr:AI-2E family transporter [Labedella endophytica]RUR03047.1 AI-2E family transporter [Labedella endophytica]
MGWFSSKVEPRLKEVVPPTAKQETAGLWSDGFGKLATRCVQIIAILIVVIGIVFAITQLTLVFIPVAIALILAAAFHPVMHAMRKKIPSIIATWIALLGIVVVLGGVVFLIVTAVRDQIDELVDSASQGIDQLYDWVLTLPFSISEEQISSFRDTAIDFVTSSQFGSGALAGVGVASNFVVGLALLIVLLFFFLKDGPKIWAFMLRPFEGSQYDRARRIGDKAVTTLGGYVRGTAAVAAVDAIGIGLVLFFLGVPLYLPLAVIVFVLAFIPLVGATLAGALAVLVALVANDPITAVWVLVAVVAVNQLEGNFLQPILMGRSLKLHPLVILVALTAGTILGGIVGAVLSVPIAAVAWGVISVWNGENEPAWPAKQKRPEPS